MGAHRGLLAAVLGCACVSSAFAVDTQRDDVRAFIASMQQAHGLDSSQVRALLRNAETKDAILEAIARPAEQTLPWFEYREKFLTARRIDRGVEFSKQYAGQLARVREQGVSPDVVIGILGVETLYGENTGKYRVLDALATLAFDYPPRAAFFRNELAEYLLLTREEKINARRALGSYAGAIGAPQFMPSNYRVIAVDGDGDGQRDLWNSWPDIVLSVTAYLKKFGWRQGEPATLSATVAPSDAANIDASKLALTETLASLRAKGVRFETSLPDATPALLIAVEGRDGAEYRVGLPNFIAIAKYNPRVKYALAVNDLGEAVARAAKDAAR